MTSIHDLSGSSYSHTNIMLYYQETREHFFDEITKIYTHIANRYARERNKGMFSLNKFHKIFNQKADILNEVNKYS